jgi:hypothetical protein
MDEAGGPFLANIARGMPLGSTWSLDHSTHFSAEVSVITDLHYIYIDSIKAFG